MIALTSGVAHAESTAHACLRCGVHGHQASPAGPCRGCKCIDALRAQIAELEFRLEKSRPRKPSRSGGRRRRRDTRFVLLDGRRLSLTEAARALGLSASTLHLRLVNRTNNPDYRETDVRAVGADVPRGRGDIATRQAPIRQSRQRHNVLDKT